MYKGPIMNYKAVFCIPNHTIYCLLSPLSIQVAARNKLNGKMEFPQVLDLEAGPLRGVMQDSSLKEFGVPHGLIPGRF